MYLKKEFHHFQVVNIYFDSPFIKNICLNNVNYNISSFVNYCDILCDFKNISLYHGFNEKIVYFLLSEQQS